MTIKLNLTIDEKIVEKSKRYAAKNNTSVSKLVEQLLENTLTSVESKIKNKSFVERTAGTLKTNIADIDQAKEDYLIKKYGH